MKRAGERKPRRRRAPAEIEGKERRTALVTGAAGFVGRYMVDELVARGYEVVATDLERAREKSGWMPPPGVEFIAADLTRRPSLEPLFARRIDHVYHLAALFDFTAPWELLVAVNVAGTETLCALAAEAKVKRFVLMSTGGVYGPPIPSLLPVREDHPKNPGNDYEKSKWMQEQAAMCFCAERGLPVVVMRPGGVIYGPGNRYGAADLLKILSLFKVAPVIVNLKARVGFVHARDIARAAIFLAERDDTIGEAFNVGDGTAYTQGEITKTLAKLLGARTVPLYVPRILLEATTKLVYAATSRLATAIYPRKLLFEPATALYLTNDYYISSEKIFGLGFRPQYPDVKKGIREFVDWYVRA